MNRSNEKKRMRQREREERSFFAFVSREYRSLESTLYRKLKYSSDSTKSLSDTADAGQFSIYRTNLDQSLADSHNENEAYFLTSLPRKKNVRKSELDMNDMSIDIIRTTAEIEKESMSLLEAQTRKEDDYQHRKDHTDSTRTKKLDVNKLIEKQLAESQFSARIWQNQLELRSELQKILYRSIANGEHSTKLSRSLRKSMDSSVSNAKRLVRTEVAKLQTEVQRYYYEKNKVEYFEWLTEDDACKSCKALDGKKVEVSDLVIGENAPPIHPNCRCSTIPVVI